ncbi:hypothetical protein LVB87_01300 [Lysobacter sp. KIS68-7]|uniref:hypothetical protein n=1 Tax=Lysobacter sp. KIS68-7 TaxID=2904252 RepID=UPI001E5A7021|nr:hypothetical protein [Lysobacter sp. KIS68-7]UHQ19830.1 hypothetical protein LVB87_01300 [Lysobacter sp. KIS68-7]
MDVRIPGTTVAMSIAMGLAGMACAATASAQSTMGTFNVSVRVVRQVAATDATPLLDAMPMPAGARRLTRIRAVDSLWVDDTPSTVARHYREAMQARGYRLAYESGDGLDSAWIDDRSHHRIALQLRPVIGAAFATRVVLQATPDT